MNTIFWYRDTPTELIKRNREIVRRRIKGESFAQIGLTYSITGERVRQIVKRFTKNMQGNPK